MTLEELDSMSLDDRLDRMGEIMSALGRRWNAMAREMMAEHGLSDDEQDRLIAAMPVPIVVGPGD